MNKTSIQLIGHRRYGAPEMRSVKQIEFSEKVDIWSIGCIFYELVAKNCFIKNCNCNETAIEDLTLKLNLDKTALQSIMDDMNGDKDSVERIWKKVITRKLNSK